MLLDTAVVKNILLMVEVNFHKNYFGSFGEKIFSMDIHNKCISEFIVNSRI